MWYFVKSLFTSNRIKTIQLDLDSLPFNSKQQEKFKEFYNQEFAKFIQRLQEERVKNLKAIKGFVSFSTLFFFISLYGVKKLFSGDQPNLFSYSFLFYAITLIIALTLKYLADRKYKKNYITIKDNLVRFFLKFFGEFDYSANQKNFEEYFNINDYEIIPNYDFSNMEDYIIGKYNNTEIRIAEYELNNILRKSNSENNITDIFLNFTANSLSGKKQRSAFDNSEIIYKGIAVEIAFNKKIKGKTLVIHDEGKIKNFFNRDKVKGYQRIALEDPLFEKKFEIYGVDQIESRYLLTPAFMQRIIDLSNSFNKSNIELIFQKDKLFLSISNDKNFLDKNTLISNKDLEKLTKKILGELTVIFSIIDILKLDKKSRI